MAPLIGTMPSQPGHTVTSGTSRRSGALRTIGRTAAAAMP